MQSGLQASEDSTRRGLGNVARQTLAIRAGAGLGDAIYLQSVARHFVEQGFAVEACSGYPEVFSQLPHCTVSGFRRERIDRLAHYSLRRGDRETTQFQDCCIQAGITEPVDLRLDWTVQNDWTGLKVLKSKLDAPLIFVPMPRAPFARKDGFGAEFLPDCRTIQRAIDLLKDRALIVQVGCGPNLFPFQNLDVDLAQKTSVEDVLDLGMIADGFIGFCSFVVPLAESFKKPALFVWSRRAKRSAHTVVRQMTPQKILHRESSRFVFDDCNQEELETAVDALLRAARGS